MLATYRAPQLPELPPLHGGLVGHLGYDVVREVEHLPNVAPDDRNLPDAAVESLAAELAAIERHRRPAEPALLAFCPVKCESYFSDNGGRVSKSEELLRNFREVYARVIEAVRAEALKADVLYAPVDTIGCVEVIDAEWPLDEQTGEAMFSAA